MTRYQALYAHHFMHRDRKASNHVPLALGIATLVITFVVLAWHAAPTVSFHDSGEFAMVAAGGGIAHPPGAPTYGLLASLWVRIVPVEDPARASNLFSAFCGGVTIALAGALAFRWSGAPAGASRGPSILAAVAASLLLLRSPAFIEQSTTTEQYTLLTALLAALWALRSLSGPGARPGLV